MSVDNNNYNTTQLAKDSIDYIEDFEGYSSCSYWDATRWSIWFWTKSYQWECIDREEAYKRKLSHIQPLINLVDKSCYTHNQKIAMISYMYNVWSGAMNISHYVSGCRKNDVLYIMWKYWYTANWEWSNWLAKRRVIEKQKFNS